MAKNPRRRAELLDAALRVLAGQGARGLTFRAVDAEAGVPAGTASNYFAGRDDLLNQAGGHIYVRLAPDPEQAAEALSGASTKEHLADLMRWIAGRMAENRTVYLALLELRLEATRRPELRATLTERIREDLEANAAGHAASGMPGGRTEVVLLYLAVNGLVVELLTLPGVLDGERAPDELIGMMVDRLVP
ncbi:TetR/AcrR family transcriptional regulator [Nocardiopsis composta]|uniref:DNA-binding transcriptional regulator YbjK n=1 Tax=Nocardiopsis composta TaxID=157465 RepID=A0A7W8QQ94_9ACTN|nr:TetR family transcriptional regulator [Nocardiopsis composta]MBB5434219.1 DNA-binding transcriptional regulator YbjK [Nocardiopsis composta]